MPTYWADFINQKLEENPYYFTGTIIEKILEDFYHYLMFELAKEGWKLQLKEESDG